MLCIWIVILFYKNIIYSLINFNLSPTPKYKWSRVDELPLTNRHQIINYGRVLRIENVEFEDVTRYRCLAYNDLGIASAEIDLKIQSKKFFFILIKYK